MIMVDVTTPGERRDADALGGIDADTALRHLYGEHWSPMVRTAWLLTGDQSAAEDLVADSLLAVHQAWDRLRSTQAAGAYLRRVVVNRSRSAVRHRIVVDRFARTDRPASTSPSAEQSVLARESRERLLAALEMLPPRQREVVVLRYFADLSEAQIAETLQIAPGSVKAHAHRALSALRARTELWDERTDDPPTGGQGGTR